MEHRGVEIVNGGFAPNRPITEFIGLSVNGPGCDSGTSQPDGKAERIVITTITTLSKRCPAKFSGPHHQRFFQQPTLVEVLEQPGNRLVGCQGIFAVVFLQVAVSVPTVISRYLRTG